MVKFGWPPCDTTCMMLKKNTLNFDLSVLSVDILSFVWHPFHECSKDNVKRVVWLMPQVSFFLDSVITFERYIKTNLYHWSYPVPEFITAESSQIFQPDLVVNLGRTHIKNLIWLAKYGATLQFQKRRDIYSLGNLFHSCWL